MVAIHATAGSVVICQQREHGAVDAIPMQGICYSEQMRHSKRQSVVWILHYSSRVHLGRVRQQHKQYPDMQKSLTEAKIRKMESKRLQRTMYSSTIMRAIGYRRKNTPNRMLPG